MVDLRTQQLTSRWFTESLLCLSFKQGGFFFFWFFGFVRNTKVHKSHRRSFFGRARASHPRMPLQASSHPLFICEGWLTHPALLQHKTETGPESYGGGRTHKHKHALTDHFYCNGNTELHSF